MSNSLCLTSQPTTLQVSETIPDGYQAVVYGTLTIPVGLTLTILGTGQLVITNFLLAQ